MRTISRSAAAIVAVAALYSITVPATTTPAAARGDVVAFNGDVSPGTIVVRTSQRRLDHVLGGGGKAIVYPVGVGRAGRPWAGTTMTRQADGRTGPRRPNRARKPNLTRGYPGGSPQNPMGAAALTLSGRRIRHPWHQGPGRSAASSLMAASECTTRTSLDLYGRVERRHAGHCHQIGGPRRTGGGRHTVFCRPFSVSGSQRKLLQHQGSRRPPP